MANLNLEQAQSENLAELLNVAQALGNQTTILTPNTMNTVLTPNTLNAIILPYDLPHSSEEYSDYSFSKYLAIGTPIASIIEPEDTDSEPVDDTVADPDFEPVEDTYADHDHDTVADPNVEPEDDVEYDPYLVDEEGVLRDDVLPKRKRSRLANPVSWRGNVRKQKRNEGAEYLSSRGKVVKARSMKNPGIDCPCNLKCSTKISHEARECLFKSYWGMSDLQRQRDYLGSMVKAMSIGRRRVKTSSKRNATLHYTLTYNGTNHRVCKTFFLNTLDINYPVVKTAVDKYCRSPSSMQSPDKRGRQAPAIKLPVSVVDFAKAHIDKFPRVPSHWCRADTTKVYLEANINKAKMYKLYQEDCKEEGGEIEEKMVSLTFYSNLLFEKRIAFHVPRKDMCWCQLYQNLPEGEKADRADEYALHIEKKKEASVKTRWRKRCRF